MWIIKWYPCFYEHSTPLSWKYYLRLGRSGLRLSNTSSSSNEFRKTNFYSNQWIYLASWFNCLSRKTALGSTSVKCFWIQVTENSTHIAFNTNRNLLVQMTEIYLGNYDFRRIFIWQVKWFIYAYSFISLKNSWEQLQMRQVLFQALEIQQLTKQSLSLLGAYIGGGMQTI